MACCSLWWFVVCFCLPWPGQIYNITGSKSFHSHLLPVKDSHYSPSPIHSTILSFLKQSKLMQPDNTCSLRPKVKKKKKKSLRFIQVLYKLWSHRLDTLMLPQEIFCAFWFSVSLNICHLHEKQKVEESNHPHMLWHDSRVGPSTN